jgi:hypothetical protein
MLPENLNINEITDARRKSLQETTRSISIEELKTIEDEIFPYHDSAWRERFSEFVAANSGSTFYHGKTKDGIHIIYCHTKEKGIWYLPGSGLGPLMEKGLKIMKQIVEKI